MYQENEFDKLEQIVAAADGLKCLAHLCEIVDNSAEQISYKDFSELLKSLALQVDRNARQIAQALQQA